MRRLAFTIVLVSGLILAACTGGTDARAPQAFPARVYVSLQGSGSVEVLPGATTWRALPGAHYIDVGPTGERLLVSGADTGNVYVVAATSGKTLATFHIGAIPQGVQIGPNGHWGLAVSAGSDSVVVLNMETLAFVKRIKVGETPHNARFSADGRRAYVTLQGGAAVAVLDLATLRKIGEIPVPGIQPHNLDLSADGRVLWVRGLRGHVAALNLATHKELAVIKVAPGHAGIDFVPHGRYVFTAGIAGNEVDVIDPETFKVVKRIEVGPGPHGVRASANGRWLYVGVTGTNEVAVIDTETLKVVKQVPARGEVPFWIAVVGNN